MVKRVRNSERQQIKREQKLKQELLQQRQQKKAKKEENNEEENVSEDFCFVCKDGGLLIVCDHTNCLKAYHPHCVGQEEATEETDAQWICGWHSCFLCKKQPKYQCFCCPNAVCLSCLKDASFARLRGNKGFCGNCLNLALLGEEGLEVDSDGEKVDFKDHETYEGLFKEYWDIVKEKEGLTLDDLHIADVQIKKGENKAENVKAQSQKLESDSDEYVKQEEKKEESSSDDLESDDDAVQPEPVIVNKIKRPKRVPKKKKGSSRIEYVGWASKNLLEFLASLGVDSSKKLSQNHVTSLIVNYVQENKLFHHEKRKMVVCDELLQSLLKRKTISVYKINDCIEAHFLENVEQSEDEGYSSESEDNNALLPAKKQAWWKNAGSFQNKGSFMEKYQVKEDVLLEPKKLEPVVEVEVVYSGFATIVLQNMKLVYLKKSLVESLLEKYETFENKIIGSYVKVKSEPVDPKCPYQLLPVIGISEASGNDNKRVLLEVSGVPDGVPLSMLSNDDLCEEDCKVLLQKIESGILPKPTVVELQKKAKDIHEDITKYSITRELSLLKNRIDQANEKGRRAEYPFYNTISIIFWFFR
ncbi:hypothetical protein vseg_021511 [Gypsophila vaccaria]